MQRQSSTIYYITMPGLVLRLSINLTTVLFVLLRRISPCLVILRWCLDPTALLKEAVDKLIDKTGVDQAITKVLVAFALEKADDDKSWDISKDIFKAATLLNNEDDAAHHLPF